MHSTLLRPALALGWLLALTLSTSAGAATIRVHYDTGFGNRIAIRGSKAPLSWTVGQNATWTTGNVWEYSWPDSVGDVEVKPLINDTTWAKGANYRVKAGTTVNVYPYFHATAGSIQYFHNFWSPQLNNVRSLRFYLPPSYSENPLKRYPVLYMHDGQNLFEASTASFGVEWQVDEAANRLIPQGQMDEVIVVGIDHGGSSRIYEYTPCCDPQYGGGGAPQYERFLLDSVKPYVERTYRTLPGKENTALMGSSLGGLISYYIGRRNPGVFSKVAGLSSSFWWNNQAMPREVEQSTVKLPLRFYLDAGTQNDGLTETTRMRDALAADGHVQGQDLYYYVAQGAGHTESAWAARVHIPLTYLFPWQSTVY
jgi:predicted alpha/beta superfamily hydrolase